MNFSQIKAIITDTNSSYWRSVDENDKKQKWQQAIRLGLKNSLVDMSSELSEESFPKYAFLGRLSEKVVYKLLTKQPKVFVNLLKVLRHYDEDFFKNVLGLSLEQAVQQSPNAVVRVLSDKKFHETSSLKQLKEALQNRKIGETKLIDVVKGSITNAEIVITELLNLDNDEDFSKHFSSKLWHDRKLVDIQELNAALPIEKVLEDLIRYHDMRKVSGFDQYDYFKLLEETLSRLHIKVKYKQRQSKGPWFDEAVVAPLYEHPSFREDLMELLNQHDSSPRLKQLLLTIVGHIPGLIKNDHLSKDQAIEAVVRAQFSTIKNSFSDKFYLNNLMSYFVLELINDVVPVSLSQRSRLKNMYRSFPYSLQNFDALTMHSIKSILQSQGFDLNDDEAIVDSLPLDLLSEMIIYVLDNINTSEDVRETITLFLKSHQPLYDYITAAIETKINETTLKDERYLKRLRLLILVPERASLQITKWMSGIKDKENQRRLQADVVNAYLENHLNDILIGHADLILHQPEGQGLIPIKEKLPDRAQQEFISLQGLQRDLQILGIDLSIELLPNFLNSKRFLTWAGMILPRLDIHQNMYRGSLVREDDKDAKYVTFHPPVALRYARHGGEAAKAKGRKGIHQLDMNLISENMVSLPISEEAMIEFKHNNLDMVAFFYDEKVYIMTQKQYDKFSLTGGISFFAGIIRFPNSTSGFVEVPDGDGIRLLRIGTDQSFQVQRLDDTIYIRKIDNFVALAFSFLDSFEESSYVRSLVSEGRSDLDTIRELMDLQSHERFLKEELMFAIDVIDASDDSLYLRWAINMIESVLNDMNPNRESKQFQAVDIRYRPQYFEFMYAMLQTAIDKIQERIINADQNGVDINWQNIKSVIRNNSNVKRLLATIKKYEGGIESYDRQLMLNPYQGMITNRRSEANWLLRKLSQSAPVKSDLQLLYDHGYLDFILPEFTDTRGVVQNSFHRGHTVDEHTFNVLQNIDELLMEPSNQDVAPDMLRVLGLFHDLGKVSQEPQHDRRSAEALVKFLSAAQMPKALQDRLADILVHHRHLGNIAASRVRRSSEEKANPSFKIFEQARIIKIIESFSKNRTSEQVLVDLKLNYLLTIADTKAIPYEKSDTGSRYSHIYAQELKFVYDRVLEHLESEISLRSLDFILPEDMKFSLKTRINPFSYGQTIGEAVIHLEQQFTYTSLDLLQNPNIEFVMSGRVLGQKDLDQPISLGVPLEIRYKTTVAPGGIIMSSDYLKMDGLKGKLFGNRDKAHEDIYTEVWMNQSVGLEYGTDLVGVGGVVHQIIPTTVKSFFGY